MKKKWNNCIGCVQTSGRSGGEREGSENVR